MQVIRHDYVSTHPCAALHRLFAEGAECGVNGLRCQDASAIRSGSGDEVNRRPCKDAIESPETRGAGIFGGDRPPLQVAQSGQQFLVDPVEPAVAEYSDDVVFAQLRHQPVDDVIGVRFVECWLA